MIIADMSGLYLVLISVLWGSSSLQYNHCFSSYTPPTTAARGNTQLLSHTLPAQEKNRHIYILFIYRQNIYIVYIYKQKRNRTKAPSSYAGVTLTKAQSLGQDQQGNES